MGELHSQIYYTILAKQFGIISCISAGCHIFMRGETETLAPAHRGGSDPYPGEELPLLIDAMHLLYHKCDMGVNPFWDGFPGA